MVQLNESVKWNKSFTTLWFISLNDERIDSNVSWTNWFKYSMFQMINEWVWRNERFCRTLYQTKTSVYIEEETGIKMSSEL